MRFPTFPLENKSIFMKGELLCALLKKEDAEKKKLGLNDY